MGCAEDFFIADGGLLSVLGDLLFAAAILMLLYPCIRRTWTRLDRNFFQQLFYILEILVAVTLLSFLLMLLVAQQMRVTYCAVIRPFIGNTQEDKIYAGVLLKLLVCLLLIFNYFCATGLQSALTSVSDWLEPSSPPSSRRLIDTDRLARPPIRSNLNARREPSPTPTGASRDALSNNNTNSQPLMTRTVTTTRANALPSMSCGVSTLCLLDRGPPLNQHSCRDVGTMVRFPGYQTPGPICTLQFPPRRGDPGPRAIVLHQTAVSASSGQAGPTPRSGWRRPKRSRSKSSKRSKTSSSSSGSSTRTVNSSAQTSGSNHIVEVQSSTTITFPNRNCTVKVQRKRVTPPRQPKLLRSGKTYGYY